jgi:hypothetical protein
VSHVNQPWLRCLVPVMFIAVVGVMLLKGAWISRAAEVAPSAAGSLSRRVHVRASVRRGDQPIGESRAIRVPLYVVSGLSIAFLLHEGHVLGASPSVPLCLAVATLVSLLYLGVGRLLAWFSVHRIIDWGVRSAVANSRTTLSGLVRGLPLLLVFSTFFVLTAELWEALALIDTPAFVSISGVLVVSFSLFLLLAAHREITHQSELATWGDVRKATVGRDGQAIRDQLTSAEIHDLLTVAGLNRWASVSDAQRRLPWRGRVNAVLVVLVYESLLLVPLAAISGFVFYCFSKLAVPARVAAEWAYGDNPTIDQVREIEARGLLAEPWFRVAVVLTLFSLLYMAVTVIADPDKRKDFFSGADCELRQRLALELVYRHALVPPPSDPSPGPALDAVLDVSNY